jgi:hypothetical protein
VQLLGRGAPLAKVGDDEPMESMALSEMIFHAKVARGLAKCVPVRELGLRGLYA